MLQSLSIQNFAIIDQVTIDFESGMTVLSGETGAGKSIIIDALGLLCGGRGSSELIRHGENRLVVEGLFTFQMQHVVIESMLADVGIEFQSAEESLILRRELTTQGKNIVRVNGQLANVQLLKRLGNFLVDIHGQHEHQALLDKNAHLALLDQFANKEIAPIMQQYDVAFRRYVEIRKKWLATLVEDQNQLQRISFLEFQVQEIEGLKLVPGEDIELEALSLKLQNSQKMSSTLQELNDVLSDSSNSALTQMNRASHLLRDLEQYDAVYTPLQQQLITITEQLTDLAHDLASHQGEALDNQAIDEVEARLSELSQLKRKYGKTIDELLAYYDEISEELYQLQHREQYAEQVAQQLQQAYQEAGRLAKQLHTIRQHYAEELVALIERELQDLYMPNSRFSIQFEKLVADTDLQALIPKAVQLSPNGFDRLEFYASTNVGEQAKALIKVASGGELSRFMLALKRAFSEAAIPQTMVFDEIDTGVSGRVAQAIAEKMKDISYQHQVLCITHLAQVAASANHQLAIQKQVVDERTHTVVNTLTNVQRVEAVAQMLAGKEVTEASRQMAQDLMNQFQN